MTSEEKSVFPYPLLSSFTSSISFLSSIYLSTIGHINPPQSNLFDPFFSSSLSLTISILISICLRFPFLNVLRLFYFIILYLLSSEVISSHLFFSPSLFLTSIGMALVVPPPIWKQHQTQTHQVMSSMPVRRSLENIQEAFSQEPPFLMSVRLN